MIEATRVRRGPLAVVEAGDADAPVLVLLHGIGSSGDAFLGQVHGLANRWRLLAPDAPGYGESDDPAELRVSTGSPTRWSVYWTTRTWTGPSCWACPGAA
ncbi:MAG: hypothetical protein Ct9H300mP12_07530 [Acidimicrobiales bacterium]|nr:MAG: hypothetical protein Ct9H300mP12_07530 [Acidimicrobiales bacterium]